MPVANASCIRQFLPDIEISPRFATIFRSCWSAPATTESHVQSLSELFDSAVKHIAADTDGRSAEKHALRIEREIRKLVAEGSAGSLAQLCDIVAAPHRRER